MGSGSFKMGSLLAWPDPISKEEANTVCSFLRSTLLHYGYPGRISTACNLALLYSPSDISCGQVYEFNIYHLMEVDDPKSLFPVSIYEVS